MSYVLLMLTDGRQSCFEATIANAGHYLPSSSAPMVVVNDCPENPDYQGWLKWRVGTFASVIPPLAERRGFAGAIQAGWDRVQDMDADFVFHLEDDFAIQRHVPLAMMADVLEMEPGIVQVALQRQPWNSLEQAAGGVVAANPTDFTEELVAGVNLLTHRRFFTTNPNLYRVGLCQRGWPQAPHSEGLFALDLFAEDPTNRSAYLGGRFDAPWVQHTGQRSGAGY